ncbi:hypothetical protein IJH26_00595 [Candidatus Saccharibacteria bacterium]|nr:hypothetical protein [Candidatus Saccharibacteria bacterium]MBQ3476002.1 hypothetical protein [Candidatus Saccharibacteria bacterium]
MTEKKKRFDWGENKGGMNLVFLGIASVAIAIITVSISLIVYHNSGDIYLDRSRPGFLPDEEEIEAEEVEEDYDFGKVEKLDAGTIEEYLKNLNIEVKAIDMYEKPFDASVLSDENLGISE